MDTPRKISIIEKAISVEKLEVVNAAIAKLESIQIILR